MGKETEIRVSQVSLQEGIHLPMPETRVRSLGWGRSTGEGNGNSLQHSCLGNPMDQGAWQAIQSMGLHRVGHNLATKQQTHSQEIAIIYMWVIILPDYVDMHIF